MAPTAAPAAIVPAAGASRRMGRPKLLLPWGESTVLESTLAALRDGGVASIVVVIAPDGPLAAWQPPAGVHVAVNPQPAAGMLSSILVGLEALATTPDHEAPGVLHDAAEPRRPAPDPLVVCPADLPALRPSTVAALLAEKKSLRSVMVVCWAI